MLNGEVEEEEEEEDMAEQHLVNLPDYWKTSVKPRGFAEFCDMYDTQGKITGLWEITQWDPKTGEVRKRTWNHNVVTDFGAINILASAIANASNANPWNRIVITNNSGSTTLTTATTAGATTSLAVAATPAAIPANYPSPANATATQVQLNFGGTSPQTANMSSGAAQGATTLAVSSFTATVWPIGTPVVPLPNIAENPSLANVTANNSTPLTANSGVISAGGFTYTPTSGAGNRLVTITFTFTVAGGFSAGSYTDCWVVNSATLTNAASGVFTGSYLCHETNNSMSLNSSNNISCSVTIKI